MSWNGLKKAMNRAGAQVLMKTGKIEQSVDLEYEFEVRRFKMMEDKSNKLQKELKQYLNTLRVISGAQENVSEVLGAYFGKKEYTGEEENLGKNKNISIAQEYHQVMKRINSECIEQLEQPYFQTVINPIARFNSYFIEINEAIKKRNHKQLDYDALRTKVRKLEENPPESPAVVTTASIEEHRAYVKKLADNQQQLETAEQVYENINSLLKEELPRLINLRIPFFDPSFESFVKLQLLFFSENFKHLNELQEKIDARTRQDYVEGKLETRIDDVLVKMKELNITGMT
ncbi:reduced viability upon starvation protein 161 [[Candida] railenensis]|uniref:Reduced viability upon starvation protein 161 n=1 Tax=[Candida] railenensis TaxID=45579 RepID=A0A9P0QNE6_9ASCO|nr:reduced viability upon starvation protein 161 [[Candida] railenensis]